MHELIIATQNKDKVEEISAILKGLDLYIMSKKDSGLTDEVEEDGETLKENAYKKAKAVIEHRPFAMVIADDTGLFVDHLGGAPGIASSRFSGGDDAENRKLILEKMEGVEDRGAKFVTSIVLLKGGEIYDVEASLQGKIATEERGEHGFGYDSIFIPNGYDQTLAELEPAVKNRISHRGQALSQLKELISQLI